MIRTQLLYEKKNIQFGSIQEQLVIHAFNRQRNIQLLQPLFSVVAPDKFDMLMRRYRSWVFPEYRYDELKYMRKASDSFKRLQGVSFRISTQ